MEHEKAMLEVLEGIRREMKLRNKLMAYDMTENKQNSTIDISEIEDSVYEDLRRKKKKKSDVKSGGGYLDSNFNKILNAMRKGFEKGSRNDDMTSLCETIISMIKSGILTNEDAQFIVLTTGQNCKPPMLNEEMEACWNSLVSKENQN